MNYDFEFRDYEPNNPLQFATVVYGELTFKLCFENCEVTEMLIYNGDHESFINENMFKFFLIKDGQYDYVNLGDLVRHIEANYGVYEDQSLQDYADETAHRNSL